MTRRRDQLETQGTEPPASAPQFDPPRSDEGLDDWFARRLRAQGISAGQTGFPVARVLAVGSLAVAVGMLLWVLSGVNGSSTSSSTTAVSTHVASSTSHTGGKSTKHKKKPLPAIPWQSIPVTVLNGYDATAPAAADAQATLTAAGWTVAGINDTNPTTTTATYVAYPPGKLAAARVVAHRLHLTKIVPIASADGVDGSLSTVAIVLGPNGLPAGG